MAIGVLGRLGDQLVPVQRLEAALHSNPQVAITTGSPGANGWDSGKYIVVERTAVRVVTNAEALQALAYPWFAKYGEDSSPG